MKLVHLLAVLGLMTLSSAALAGDSVQFTCVGENIELHALGSEGVDPSGKIIFAIKLDIDAKISSGDIVIRGLKYSGTKNVFGGLRQYPIMFSASNHPDKIQKGVFDSVSIAANNKPGQSGATFFDKDMNEENLEFVCQGIQ